MTLLAELRRRNVIRMAGLYLVGAWLITQVAGTVLPMFDAPAWLPRSVVVLLAIGFIPALVFSWVFEMTPEGLKRDSDAAQSQSIAPQTARRLDRAIIVMLVVALGYFAFDRFVLDPRRDAAQVAKVKAEASGAERLTASTSSGDSASSSASDVPSKSIAVLPLANAGGDEDQQYFSDGLSENLITALSQFAGLKVISRNSSFAFRDSREDSASIGRKLGVAHLLEGSVRRLGDTVRIHASLVLATDGSTLWSERYDRPYQDLFKLQDDITLAVAGELKGRLVDRAEAQAQSDRPPSGDLAAYNAYLQGNYQSNILTSETLQRAIGYYREATRLDPDYARAWAAMALAQSIHAGSFAHGDALREDMRDARRSIDRALALAPNSGFVRAIEANTLMSAELRFVESERAARRAVTLSADSYILAEYGLSRFALGDAKGGEVFQRRALDLDPLSARTWFWLSINLATQGRYTEALAAIDRNLELRASSTPSRAQRVSVRMLSGEHEEALADARAIAPGNWRDIAVALASQRAGDKAEADRALKSLVDTAGDGSAYQIAEAYALRGEPDQVFAWLDRAFDNRDPGIRLLLTDPFIAPYRNDPRFDALCDRIGLPRPGEPLDLPAGAELIPHEQVMGR